MKGYFDMAVIDYREAVLFPLMMKRVPYRSNEIEYDKYEILDGDGHEVAKLGSGSEAEVNVLVQSANACQLVRFDRLTELAKDPARLVAMVRLHEKHTTAELEAARAALLSPVAVGDRVPHNIFGMGVVTAHTDIVEVNWPRSAQKSTIISAKQLTVEEPA